MRYGLKVSDLVDTHAGDGGFVPAIAGLVFLAQTTKRSKSRSFLSGSVDIIPRI
jgi:hypothetical protein